MTNTVLAPEKQLDIFPATADDFEYLIKYKYGQGDWHPIVLQNETYTCVWWGCTDLSISETAHLEHYEIIRNPNYKGNKE